MAKEQKTNKQRQHMLSEEKYRLVIDNAKEIILIAQDGRVKWANQKMYEITGYSEKEVLSQPFIKFIHPDDREMVMATYTKRVKGEKVPDVYSFRVVGSNDEIRWLQISAVSTIWENKPATLNFLIDITEQKEAEDKIIEKERQLHRAQRMEAIGRLTGGIAHDFNNMLTVILGYSDYLLKHYETNHHLTPFMKNIKEAGEKAASLTQQLLAFSRRQFLQPRVVNLNTIIANTKKMLERLLDEDIHLVINLEPALNNSKLDENQIEQVLMNLAINAGDAMPKGGTLLIKSKNIYLSEEYIDNHFSPKPGYYVMIAVSDNGIGMDKETLEHVFEPFFTTKEESKGTGLGLSTVYGIVKQSNGYIGVYSEPGEGTTFKIYFPRVTEKVDIEVISKSKTPLLSGSENILLVEDDDIVRDSIYSIITSKGYSVITAKNGEDVFKEINKKPIQKPHLLITDIIMPGISGFNLAEIMKQKFPDIKILYMSGYSNNAITQRGFLEDGVPFIQKPFTMNDICIKIREVLDNT
jgi:two-component system cell cycle sensor histidine kinase/response regulator CckA